MRYTWILAALLVCLTAVACGGQVEVVEVPVTVTPLPADTQRALANAAGPAATPTWQQWLEQQMSKGKCPNPAGTIRYRNPKMEPPYSADFFCVSPTPTPNPFATQAVAITATIAPTRAPISTPTPGWRTTATPWPTPQTIYTPLPTPTARPTPTPRTLLPTVRPVLFTRTPALTPTMKELAEWDPETNYAWDVCWKKGGEFEIFDVRQRADGGWSWNYRCAQDPGPQDPRPQDGQDIVQELVRCGTSLEAITEAMATSGIPVQSIVGCMAPVLIDKLFEMFSEDSTSSNDGGTNPQLKAEFGNSAVVPAGNELRIGAQGERYGYLNYKFLSVKDTNSKELLNLKFRVYSNGQVLRSVETAGESGSFVVHEGETIILEFDNGSSLATGKRVWWSWHWSESPDYKYRHQ